MFYNAIIAGSEDYDWCAFIDCDEFLTFNKDCGYTNIKDFLYSNPNIKAYKVNWMCYGDNGHILKTDGNLVDRFIEPMPLDFHALYDFPENSHVKTILHRDVHLYFRSNPHVILEYKDYFMPSGNKCTHEGDLSDVFNFNIDYSTLYIRHFYTKSLAEWCTNKLGRGYADHNHDFMKEKEIDTYPLKRYFIYNKITDEKLNYLKEHGIKFEKE